MRKIIFDMNLDIPYDDLKREIIHFTSLTDQQIIEQPLVRVQLGDNTQSTLKWHMTNILRSRLVHKFPLYHFWLRRLRVFSVGNKKVQLHTMSPMVKIRVTDVRFEHVQLGTVESLPPNNFTH